MADGLTGDEEQATKQFLEEVNRWREQNGAAPVCWATAVKFLAARKFHTQRAIELFHAYRLTRIREGIYGLRPDEEPLRSELSSGKFTILSGRDPGGAALALFTARLHEPARAAHTVVLQAVLYQLDRAVERRYQYAHNGLVFVYDMTDSTYRNFDYELCVKMLNLLKGAFPARLKRVLIVSSPIWFRAPFTVLRLFVREKLRDRVCTVRLSELQAFVPCASLPSQLGGSLPLDHTGWLQACASSNSVSTTGYTSMDDLLFLPSVSNNAPLSPCNNQRQPNGAQPGSGGGGGGTGNKHACNDTQTFKCITCTVCIDSEYTVLVTPSSSHMFVSPALVPLVGVGSIAADGEEGWLHGGIGPGRTLEELVYHLKAVRKRGIYSEYEEIARQPPTGTFHCSKLPYNFGKNRYTDVLCLDQSRVKLGSSGNDEKMDYINASFMDGYKQHNAYIATQGPIPQTFVDFWRMVWEQRVQVIVMTTRVVERGRVKCGQYWPLDATSSCTFGPFTVTSLHLEKFQDYNLTTLEVHNMQTGETREVAHYQYMSWPDFGVPRSALGMLDFLAHVSRHQAAATQALG
uniref:protein-tyrosine-phosphatase n=1 Tax=Petromyzon marinus TaxID=7757 RepID=S4RBZ9_PETMA